MKLKIGDRVRFLSATGEGEVVEIVSGDRVMVEDETGFSYEHAVADLIIIPDPSAEIEQYNRVEPNMSEIIHRNIDSNAVEKAQRDFTLKYGRKKESKGRRRGDFMEVDLHIHELVDSELGLDNRDILQIQIAHFERMLKRAEEQKVSKVVFIHGIGQGVLRGEIRKIIEMYYPNASFHDANYVEYGYGATEIRLN